MRRQYLEDLPQCWNLLAREPGTQVYRDVVENPSRL
jgi:hypothetical protein